MPKTGTGLWDNQFLGLFTQKNRFYAKKRPEWLVSSMAIRSAFWTI